jgi:hypothetical protein
MLFSINRLCLQLNWDVMLRFPMHQVILPPKVVYLKSFEFYGGFCIVRYVNLVLVHIYHTKLHLSQKWFSNPNFAFEVNYGCN